MLIRAFSEVYRVAPFASGAPSRVEQSQRSASAMILPVRSVNARPVRGWLTGPAQGPRTPQRASGDTERKRKIERNGEAG